MAEQKVEGAVCSQCGKGKIVKSPKTGKLFCDQKCWLQGGGSGQSKPSGDFQKQNGNKFDPKSTIVSYAKDIIVELIKKDVIKNVEQALNGTTKIADGMWMWYDKGTVFNQSKNDMPESLKLGEEEEPPDFNG